jgi:hypothetical protein
MATVSVGQITITDLYDAPAVSAWISASQTTAQTYNNTTNTWSPSYASSAQVLTLNLTKAGSSTSLIGANVSGVTWKKRVGTITTEVTSTTTTDAEYKSGTSNHILNTKTNIPKADNAIIWSVSGTWTDPDSGLPVAFSADITLTLVQLAKAALIPYIYAPNGDVFRNGAPGSLEINCDLYKDGLLSSGSKKIKWFKADSSVSTSQDSDAGVGWAKITVTSGTTGCYASSGFDTAVTSNGVLTVFPNAVTNGQTFLCVIIDNAGGTSGMKVKGYLTLRDMDDPIVVAIDSTGGDVFKNGVGLSTLTALLYQNGDEIDAGGTTYTYKWSKWENNDMVPNFGGAGNAYKVGKSLTIGGADVNGISNFKCEVIK